MESTQVVIETDIKEKYDSVLRDKLQELRDEFEDEAENIKLDVENSYKLKVGSVSSLAVRGLDLVILFIMIKVVIMLYFHHFSYNLGRI